MLTQINAPALTAGRPRPAAIGVPTRRIKSYMAASAAKVAGPAADWISEHLPTGPVVRERSLGGSSWASTYVYETEQGAKYFVKVAMGGRDEGMFKGEALGLQAMYDTHTLRVPKVHHVGPMPNGRGSFIIMEHLDFSGSAGQEQLGRRLAEMHKAQPQDPNAAAGKFGFPVDNTIGGTPQPNGWCDDWIEFYRERRLRHQLKLARGRCAAHTIRGQLLPHLDVFFSDIRGQIQPSVLHGDLWSGNIATAVGGEPAVFDPATYYGHSEAEFGMSWCAGFSGAFWSGYHSVMPQAPLFDQRRDLYQLYHYLNHYNLFGGGYYRTAANIMEKLIKQM